jgi:hypothetical protein
MPHVERPDHFVTVLDESFGTGSSPQRWLRWASAEGLPAAPFTVLRSRDAFFIPFFWIAEIGVANDA